MSIQEKHAMDQLALVITSTRQQRNEDRIAILDALEKEDDVTREVARLCIEYYIDESPPEELLVKRHRWGVDIVRLLAPSVFMADNDLRKMLLQTGEFIHTGAFAQSAESLGFNGNIGYRVSDFLFQWVAAQNPDSPASKTVAELGLASGRMSHNINGKGDFNTGALLFHESAARNYVDSVLAGSSAPRADIDPIICLAACDNWDLAISMMSDRRRRKLMSGSVL